LSLAEQDGFVLEENLHDLMEAVNQTSVSVQWHFFINIGDKQI
jgi:hypothetical protein